MHDERLHHEPMIDEGTVEIDRTIGSRCAQQAVGTDGGGSSTENLRRRKSAVDRSNVTVIKAAETKTQRAKTSSRAVSTRRMRRTRGWPDMIARTLNPNAPRQALRGSRVSRCCAKRQVLSVRYGDIQPYLGHRQGADSQNEGFENARNGAALMSREATTAQVNDLRAPLQRPPVAGYRTAGRFLGLRKLAVKPVWLVSSATKSARQLSARLGPECVGKLLSSGFGLILIDPTRWRPRMG